jgi:hypothetical protein
MAEDHDQIKILSGKDPSDLSGKDPSGKDPSGKDPPG